MGTTNPLILGNARRPKIAVLGSDSGLDSAIHCRPAQRCRSVFNESLGITGEYSLRPSGIDLDDTGEVFSRNGEIFSGSIVMTQRNWNSVPNQLLHSETEE